MKFTAQKKDLLDCMATAFAVSPTRTPKEILKNIKATVRRGVLTLTGTNEETSVSLSLNVDDSDDGECLLSPKMLAAVREGTGERVSVEDDTHGLNVYCGLGEWSFVTEDPAEFPVFSEQKVELVGVSGFDLKRAIECVSGAVSTVAGRNIAYTGVYLSLDDKVLSVAGGDGVRMAFAEVECEATGKFTVVVPMGAANALLRLCDEASLQIGGSENEFVLQSDWASLHTRVIEGRFPPYKQICPKSFQVTANVDSSDLRSVIRQVMITTNPETSAVKFQVEHDGLTLSSVAASVGKGKASCACSANGSSEVELTPAFILDFVRKSGDDEAIVVQLNGHDELVLVSHRDASLLVAPLVEG